MGTMRIISGRLKGRKLRSFRGSTVRPTSDRVREALFSILAFKPIDATVLDLFAGSGALGIEAISRGAARAVFVDKVPKALALVRDNVACCGIADRTKIIHCDAAAGLNCLLPYPQTFDLVFMDPPYGKNLVSIAMEHLLACDCLKPNATIVAEHGADEHINVALGILHLMDQRRYGRTSLSFYRYDPPSRQD